MNSISANLNIMIKAAEKASKILIRDFGELEKLQVSTKGPLDFVTNSDKKVEKVILNELSKSRKNFCILSEEIGEIKNSDKDNFWIIDPIDGTTNFMHGVPHFAISIALKTNNEIVSGLILDPIKNEMFYAEKDNGAFFNNQRIRVSKKRKIDECLFATGGKNEFKSKLNTRRSGSAALDMAYVGAGRYDGYFQKNLKIWDIAAGIIIVNEAGGKINKIDNSDNNDLNVIAGSNSIYDKLLENLSNF